MAGPPRVYASQQIPPYRHPENDLLNHSRQPHSSVFDAESSVNRNPFFSRIKNLIRVFHCLLARFDNGNHRVPNCLTVRNGVGQQIPRGLVRFCHERFAVGCSVLLSLVQRRTLVSVRD